MKQFICYCLLLLSLPALAQHIQHGRVTAYGREGATLANVQLIAKDAPPSTSDDNGVFRLRFARKKPGDALELETVEKAGYEWANREQFLYALLPKNVYDTIQLVMARPGEVTAAKIKIYNVTGVVLQRVFDERVAGLKEQLKSGIISQQQLNIQVTELQAALEACQQRKDQLAEFAARFYTTGDATANRLVSLLETGEIDKAVQILDSLSIIETANRLLLAKQQIQPGYEADSLETLINRHVQLMMLATSIYTLNLDAKKVEALYKKLLQLQPYNLEALKEIAAYYRATGRYHDALQLLGRLRLLLPDMRLRARILSLTGHIYSDMGYKDSALHYYTRHLEELQLLTQNGSQPAYKTELALAEKNLGAWYQQNHQVKAAIQHYQAAERITAGEYKNNDSAWGEHVNSLASLGIAWNLLYRYDSAAACFEQGRKILTPLYNAVGLEQIIRPRLANIYSLLGEVYHNTGDYAQARRLLEDALQLREAEWKLNPNREEPVRQLAATCRQLATTLSHIKKDTVLYNQALGLYRRALTLYRQLNVENPANVMHIYNQGLVLGDIALHDFRHKKNKRGLDWAQHYRILAKALHQQHPQAPEHAYLYAQALYMEALVNRLRHWKLARANLQAAIPLLQQVLKQSPGDYLARARLGECYLQLARRKYFQFYNKRLARMYLQAAEQFFPLCAETGYPYFCRMLNAARSGANNAWLFGVREKF